MNDRHLITLRMIAVLAAVGLPGVALAQGTAEQQQACTPDAVKLCSDTIPDIPKTTACMKAHFTQLTPRWLAIGGYVVAVVLLIRSYYLDWSILVFPLWVLLVSICILLDKEKEPLA